MPCPIRVLLGAISVLLLSPVLAIPPAPVTYTLSAPEPHTHFFHVEVRVPGVPPEGIRFTFPAWMPGGYGIREVSGNVLDFRAEDRSGAPLVVEKLDKLTWAIPRGGGDEIVLRYRIWANERGTPYAARVNEKMAHANLVRVLGYVEDRLGHPGRITFVPTGDWEIASSLEPVTGAADTFQAPDWDELADGIVLMGRWHEEGFEDGGARYRMVFSEKPDFRETDPVGDVRKIARESAAVFGETPFDRYLFLYLLEPDGGRGGIEHLYGTSMSAPRDSFSERARYRYLLSLTAHELVHAWNVKRLRPEGLGPFHYTREVYTRLLYVAEGFTSYYGPLVEARVGTASREEFLRDVAGWIVRDRDNVGVRHKSLEEFSWDTWLRSGIPFLTFRTYYVRGALVGMILDLRLRHRTGGERGLDDVMRDLWTRFARAPRGYTDTDLRAALVRAGGEGMDELLDSLVGRTGPLDVTGALALAGLEVVPEPGRAAVPFLGVRTESTGTDFPLADWIEPGSPAEQAGLQSRDRLIALDGRRLRAEGLEQALVEIGAGRTIEVAFFRDGILRRAEVTLGTAVPPALQIHEREGASEAQRRLLEGWLAPRAGR
jgi:predicted metalloprotease with PDZ domain